MKKIKIIFALLAVFLIIFTTSVSASAAESEILSEINQEVQEHVDAGRLPKWHLEYMQWSGYTCYYNKMVKFSNNFDYFASQSEDEI